MKEKDLEKINSGDVPYKYYPKIYLYMLKGFVKSIKYKTQYNLDKKINDCLKEYKNILRNDITNIISFTSKNLIDYKKLDEKIENIKKTIDIITKYYVEEYSDAKIIELFMNSNLKLDDNFFKNKNTNFDEIVDTNQYLKDISLEEIYEKAKCSHFKISKNGIITEIDGLMGYTNKYGLIIDLNKFLIRANILDAKEILEKEEVDIKNTNGNLDKFITIFNDKINLRELLLNAIMYNIIKTGDIRVGPKRAFLFANEFGLNIDIPMMYGIEGTYAPDNDFIKIYLNNGGRKDNLMFIDFFYDGIYRVMFDRMTISEYINNTPNFYSKEEVEEVNKVLSLKNNTDK